MNITIYVGNAFRLHSSHTTTHGLLAGNRCEKGLATGLLLRFANE